MVESSTPCAVDRGCWATTLVVGTGFCVLLSIHLMLGWPNSPWLGPSRVGPDMAATIAEARVIATGHLHSLYNVGSYDNLPLWPLLLAPVMVVADMLGPKSSPTGLLPAGYVVIPASLVVGIMLAHAGRTLAWQLGARRRLWVMQIVLLFCVLLPCLTYGHMEDALALSLMLYSVRLLRSGRIDAAGLLMGLSIASKEWGLLVLPILVVAVGQRSRRFVALALAPPVLLGLTALALDPGPAVQQLLARTTYSSSPVLRYGFSALLGERGSQLVRPVELALVLLSAKRLRHSRRALLSFAVVGALLLRPLAEPVVFPYYWAPSVGFLILLLATRARTAASPWLLLPAALTLWSPRWDIPGVLWWPGELTLLGMALLVAMPAIRGLLRQSGTLLTAFEQEQPRVPWHVHVGSDVISRDIVHGCPGT